MDIGGDGVGVYAEAKGEYTRQLCQFLVPALQSFFLTMLEDAKTKDPESRKLLLSFQTLLEGIAEWNADKVQRETAALITASHCDYMEELLTAVFIAHTKILSAIRLTSRQKKLQITIPKLDHFLHRTLTECARLLWSNTYLFSTSGSSIERQKNMRQIEGLINDGVNQAIRSMLPVKSILKEYLRDDDDDDKEDEKEEKEEKVEKEVEKEEKEEAEKVEKEEKEEKPVEKAEEPAEKAEEPVEKAEEEKEKPVEKAEEKIEKVEEKVEKPLEVEKPVEVEEPVKPEKVEKLTPTIIIGAENDSHVQFTGLDSVFNSDNPEESGFKKMTEESDEGLEILDFPPEPMDGFEVLDDENLPMDGFEEL
jgi:hypothetical protein